MWTQHTKFAAPAKPATGVCRHCGVAIVQFGGSESKLWHDQSELIFPQFCRNSKGDADIQHEPLLTIGYGEMQKHPECKDACQQSVAYGTWPEHSCNPKCAWLTNPPPASECVEVLGERCIDGGKCHHGCNLRCFRRECCEPFSDYQGPWKYESADLTPDPLEGMRGMTADDAEALIKECCAQAGRSDTSVFTPVAWNILHRVVQAAHKAGAQARDAALKQTPMTPDQVALNAMVIFQSDFNSLPDYDLAIVRMCERFHKIG